MPQSRITITAAEVIDLRVPTSDQMLGSDPFHKAPDYSSAVLYLETDADLQSVSVVFTAAQVQTGFATASAISASRVVGSRLEGIPPLRCNSIGD